MMSLQDKKTLNNKDNKDKGYNEITQNKVPFIIYFMNFNKSKMNGNDSIASEEKEESKKNPSDKENPKKIKRLAKITIKKHQTTNIFF